MIPDLFHYWMSGNAVCEFTGRIADRSLHRHLDGAHDRHRRGYHRGT
jgi:hypothetical protein